eukprot:GHVU01137620.1.p1 GENE.GHVU01137620.1~~GHVU01137620.1.p1  ORF type:complete len:436 (-),score=74.31 GHVU01137620.1:1653-2960(-)
MGDYDDSLAVLSCAFGMYFSEDELFAHLMQANGDLQEAAESVQKRYDALASQGAQPSAPSRFGQNEKVSYSAMVKQGRLTDVFPDRGKTEVQNALEASEGSMAMASALLLGDDLPVEGNAAAPLPTGTAADDPSEDNEDGGSIVSSYSDDGDGAWVAVGGGGSRGRARGLKNREDTYSSTTYVSSNRSCSSSAARRRHRAKDPPYLPLHSVDVSGLRTKTCDELTEGVFARYPDLVRPDVEPPWEPTPQSVTDLESRQQVWKNDFRNSKKYTKKRNAFRVDSIVRGVSLKTEILHADQQHVECRVEGVRKLMAVNNIWMRDKWVRPPCSSDGKTNNDAKWRTVDVHGFPPIEGFLATIERYGFLQRYYRALDYRPGSRGPGAKSLTFHIITGVGFHSRQQSTPVLQQFVCDTLTRHGFKWRRGDPGIILMRLDVW